MASRAITNVMRGWTFAALVGAMQLGLGLAGGADAKPSGRPDEGALAPLVKDMPRCDPARAYCFALRVHVPLDETATPIATADWIARQVATANAQFAAMDVGFEVATALPLPASAVRVEDRKERSSFGARLGKGVIDWFVTGHLDDVDVAGEMAYGVTWRRGDRKFVIVSTQAWERTLAHELGHFFGLPHSTYAISIMNKTKRDEPPIEERRFADEEFAKMRPRVKELVRTRVLANRRAPSKSKSLPTPKSKPTKT